MPRTPDPAPSRASLPVGTLVAGCLAVCLAQIGLAMPATLNGLFQEHLHPVGSQLTWISDAFLLPVAVLELSFGVLGDLFGRRRLLIGGALLLCAGEVVAATASGIHQLWAGQALAGLGAAALFPTSLAMIAAGTPSGAQRARAIAVWASSLSAGGFLAPLLGGVTGTYGSWRSAFIVVAVLAAASALVSLLAAADSRAPEGRSLDVAGQVTIGIGLFALLYAVIQGPTDGWGSTPVVVAFVLAAVFLALFVAAELRARSPLLRLDLFRNRSFAIAAVVAVVGMFSFLGTAYAASIRLGPIQHQSPLRTAFAFLLLNGLTPFLTPLTSRLLHRLHARVPLTIGLALIAAGDFLAATLDVDDRALSSLILPLGLVGVGFALTVSSITATAVNTVPVHLAGMASGATNLLRDFGFTLGPAVIGAVALGQAATRVSTSLATAPGLSTESRGAAHEVLKEGGPLALNSVPAESAPGAARAYALDALGHGYAIGFVVCGCAALFSALLVVTALRGEGATEAAQQPEVKHPALS
ncbi:MFS transporter [Streptomyces diastatochromogenes]|uniref:MFS transporter n=1 Tax=Streptomyces diastatochromogenes TaxID=42236 RepID=A0A233S1A5_STRDA|nr:MFS transporter [Streptomyces diastatochromogenes]MCZ0984926.1 MFS transporter [Streptomyces diastatochromogenes]OXY89416.1 MFS transporter [Streptomyces diastatochromogenes]